jgi:hypothetical protein
VKKHGEIKLGGTHALNPRTECWPTGVPLIIENAAMQIIQQPDKITNLRGSSGAHEPTSPRANDLLPSLGPDGAVARNHLC